MNIQEAIKQNALLAELQPEQVQAIVETATNAIETATAARAGEIRGRLDTDIQALTGVPNTDNSPTHVYLKQAVASKLESTSNMAEITEYKTQIETLKAELLAGNKDESVKQQIADAQAKARAATDMYESGKTAWETEKAEHVQAMLASKVNAQFAKAETGIKYKPVYDKKVVETLVGVTKADILREYKAGFVGEGVNKTMVFRDDNGEILRNKANGLEPYTPAELLAERLGDLVDTGQKQTGIGTNPTGENNAVLAVDIIGAKTQVQADALIEQHLLQLGEIKGTRSFTEKQKDLRESSNVMGLPFN